MNIVARTSATCSAAPLQAHVILVTGPCRVWPADDIVGEKAIAAKPGKVHVILVTRPCRALPADIIVGNKTPAKPDNAHVIL